ncbi:hypothetical protein F444_22327 [Phytophthora nicotianae P1976]|uniref:Uncharacterized protein n=1 Tax=Phytophthora nicotianae P1976 TaxID=1317066 RepID=A0A080YY43_PHYNI|nr:hypothetical protein F444_22327 [Phytophthora nicotianae P1976]
MAAEMKKTREILYKQFNGIDLNAIRDSTVLLTEVKETAIDESKIIPLLDITSFEVSGVTVRHVFDYVFYKEALNALEETESTLSDGLSDSEDDEAEAVAEKALSTRNQ